MRKQEVVGEEGFRGKIGQCWRAERKPWQTLPFRGSEKPGGCDSGSHQLSVYVPADLHLKPNPHTGYLEVRPRGEALPLRKGAGALWKRSHVFLPGKNTAPTPLNLEAAYSLEGLFADEP